MDSLSFKPHSLCYWCRTLTSHTLSEHEHSVRLNTPDENPLSHEPKHPTDAVAYDITKPFSTDKA
jgi:hypothetical protein